LCGPFVFYYTAHRVITALFLVQVLRPHGQKHIDIIDRYAVRRSLMALFCAAIAFFLRFMLGFSKCWRFLTSVRIPAFAHCFLNLLNAFSKGSFSPTLIPAIHFPPPLSVFLGELWKDQSISFSMVFFQSNIQKTN
jgi:hypothetical protein